MTFATIKTFLNDESGAVTVDWVVLTAALVGLGIAAMGVVRGGVAGLTGDISNALVDTAPVTGGFSADEINTGQLTTQ